MTSQRGDLLPARLNGRELAKWETVMREYDGTDVVFSIFSAHENKTRMLSTADELILNGEVVNGARRGLKFEVRPLSEHLRRDVYYSGEHSKACRRTSDGWVCHVDCTVQDAPSTPTTIIDVDDLINVLKDVKRRWLRLNWSLSRRSRRRRFVNGRCVVPTGEHIRTETWHQGKTWTRRGARRAMELHLG